MIFVLYIPGTTLRSVLKQRDSLEVSSCSILVYLRFTNKVLQLVRDPRCLGYPEQLHGRVMSVQAIPTPTVHLLLALQKVLSP
jgi:hypothetical protein